MKSFEFESWDDGRLTINKECTDVLQANGFTTFESLMQYSGGSIAKNLLRERTTTRFELVDNDGSAQAFYIKRHSRPPLKEYLKPWFRLTVPILGAENEWNAMLRFHEVGIPTMVPVALGRRGLSSFVMTKSIEGYQKLSDWMDLCTGQDEDVDAQKMRNVIERVAEIARMMHGAGMHHQDFYLTHLLLPEDESAGEIRVIDLGRVRSCRNLAMRWIVKDLAQLNYSARMVSRDDRRRFLETYLDRPLRNDDQPFVRRIERKSHAIARHSQKNRL